MSGTLALQIEAAARRVAALECSYRVFRDGFPAAAERVGERVGEQLDAALLELSRLEAEAGQ